MEEITGVGAAQRYGEGLFAKYALAIHFASLHPGARPRYANRLRQSPSQRVLYPHPPSRQCRVSHRLSGNKSTNINSEFVAAIARQDKRNLPIPCGPERLLLAAPSAQPQQSERLSS